MSLHYAFRHFSSAVAAATLEKIKNPLGRFSKFGIVSAPSVTGQVVVENGWKRKPGKRTEMLMERSMEEQVENLRYLSKSPIGPSKAVSLHRILQRVTNEQEFRLAVKAFNIAIANRMKFTSETSSLFVSASIKSNQMKKMIEIFQDSKDHLLVPTKSSLHDLIVGIKSTKAFDLLPSVVKLFIAHKIVPTFSTWIYILQVHLLQSKLSSALKVYRNYNNLIEKASLKHDSNTEENRNRAQKTLRKQNDHALKLILRYAIENPNAVGELADEEKAFFNEKVIGDAKTSTNAELLDLVGKTNPAP
jgi:hypothetical protein